MKTILNEINKINEINEINKINEINEINENKKKTLGQFYTTNYEYILQGLKIPDDIINIIEPFCGNGDLIKFIETYNIKYNIECYDIDPPKNEKYKCIKQDTLKIPPNYNNKYLITNPPYLARNKCKDKILFDKYDVNDLYKCLIKEIITNTCLGGIIIIPLNFWSSIRTSDIKLRKMFLIKYNIILLNIFEERVFDDTSYTICSFQFEINNKITNHKLNIIIYPSKNKITTELNDKNNYSIGGEIYNLKLNNKYKITRLTTKNKDKKNTNILVKCIDDNEHNKIGLYYVNDNNIYIDNTPKQTARTYATLIIEPKINDDKQKKLIIKFNNYLNEYRLKYNSLFLTNYRESKDISRKRISFDLVYSLTEYILDNFDDI